MYGRVQFFFFAEHTCYLFKRGGRKESPFFLTVVWLAVVVNRGIVHHCPSTASQKSTGMYTACLFLSSEMFLLSLSLLVCGMS